MKRLILLLPLAGGCINWDLQLANKLIALDAGEMPDASMPDAGVPDSGMPDAGPPCDAGTWCLVGSYAGGYHIDSAQPDGQGHFVALMWPPVTGTSSLVSYSAGSYTATELPTYAYEMNQYDSISSEPNQMSARNGRIAIADYGAGAIFDVSDVIGGQSGIATATCGVSAGPNQEFYGVAWRDDETALFVGRDISGVGGHLCELSRDGGVRAIDVNPGSNRLSAVAVTAAAIYVGDDTGTLFTLDGGALPAISWSNANNTEEIFSIAGPDESALFAVHFSGNDIEQYDSNGNWKSFVPPPPFGSGVNGYSRLWVTAANDFWLCADNNVGHWDGSHWTSLELSPVDATLAIESIAAIGANDIAIAGTVPGSGGRFYVFHRF